LQWIRSFENQNNETGVPLTQSLRKANMFWYEMKTDNMADFVANVNYDRSLFIATFANRSFIDQRMIGLSLKEDYQNENRILLLALLTTYKLSLSSCTKIWYAIQAPLGDSSVCPRLCHLP